MPELDKLTLIALPDDAWQTLSETLEMDMDSGSIERSLRREIADAFGTVEHIHGEVLAIVQNVDNLSHDELVAAVRELGQRLLAVGADVGADEDDADDED